MTERADYTPDELDPRDGLPTCAAATARGKCCPGHYAEWVCDCGALCAGRRSLTPSIDWSCAMCQSRGVKDDKR